METQKTNGCPKCGEEIEELFFSAEVTNLGTFNLSTGHQDDGVEDDHPKYSYYCPECNELLFRDEEKAEAFLRRLANSYRSRIDAPRSSPGWPCQWSSRGASFRGVFVLPQRTRGLHLPCTSRSFESLNSKRVQNPLLFAFIIPRRGSAKKRHRRHRIFERGHVQVGVILIHHLGGVAGQFHAHILWHTRVGQGRIKTVS